MLVAFSGGVDSTFLAWLAHEVLSRRALAVTASSAIFASSESQQARYIAQHIGLNHITIETDQLEDPIFAANTPQRCYHCKRRLWQRLKDIACEEGLAFILDGSNSDDRHDIRPGMKANEEFDILSPLLECGLTKQEIRILSRDRGLPNWDKPASPCLATRIPHGTPITQELLELVESAEERIRRLGLTDFRVRHHGSAARIQASAADKALLSHDGVRQQAVEELQGLGYDHVTFDVLSPRPMSAEARSTS